MNVFAILLAMAIIAPLAAAGGAAVHLWTERAILRELPKHRAECRWFIVKMIGLSTFAFWCAVLGAALVTP